MTPYQTIKNANADYQLLVFSKSDCNSHKRICLKILTTKAITQKFFTTFTIHLNRRKLFAVICPNEEVLSICTNLLVF